jgi:transposase
MGYIQGTPRDQSLLFPEVLDDYIAEDNPVRFIDVFVDSLDLDDLGFQKSESASTGRPPKRLGVSP